MQISAIYTFFVFLSPPNIEQLREKLKEEWKKPRFKKSEMHGGLPSNFRKFDQNAASQQGTLVSASAPRRGAYKYPNK